MSHERTGDQFRTLRCGHRRGDGPKSHPALNPIDLFSRAEHREKRKTARPAAAPEKREESTALITDLMQAASISESRQNDG
jgi:hypothetical protein